MSWSIPSKEEDEEFTNWLAAQDAYYDECMDDVMNEQKLIGETIKNIYIDGRGIEMVFESGKTFIYDVAAGGYSVGRLNE